MSQEEQKGEIRLSDALIAGPHAEGSPSPSPGSASADGGETSFPKSKIHILLLESVHTSAVNHLVKQGFMVETAHHLTEDELIEKIKTIHAIGVRSKMKLPQRVLCHAKKLLCVGCFCIGTDQTDLEFAAKKGIPVFNSPFANTRSVAELVIAHCVVLARKAGDQNRWMHQGQWKKTATGCYEIRGKTLGIIGYGHVGSQLSVLAESMGMNVIYYDIIPKLPLGNAISVDSLNKVLTQSDFVSLHVPYTPDTHGMIGPDELKLMKKGSYLMNAARGKCVDIDSVAKYLRSGHLAGAYFDVYPSEPIDDTLSLIDCPNCVLTPHIGGSTQEAQKNIGVEVADKITRFINEGKTIASANFPEVGMAPNANAHRILHIHQNVPGVLKKTMEVLSDFNVSAQSLQTRGDVGYMVVDIDADRVMSSEVKRKIDGLAETIRTRVLYSPGFI